MLNLSAENIQLNATAHSKQEAIQLVANGLISNGNVADGYQQAMLDRETQTSTFLGNGIAIPHGTLETRHLVQQTGVQIYQFPQGVDWEETSQGGQVTKEGESNKAYIVIGIAAKSDEHLGLLRQLTHILADEEIANTLAQTDNLTHFIDLLSGKKTEELPAISSELLSLDLDSISLLTLSAINASKLHERGYVQPSFLQNILANRPLALGDNLFLNDSTEGNLANGIAVARNKEGKTLITISATNYLFVHQLTPLFSLTTRQKITVSPAPQIIDLLSNTAENSTSANTPEQSNHSISRTFTIHNAHGLHARPSAVLVNEAKKYQATIKVQNLDKNSPLVNAKSLMKVVSLGATKGSILRFVAEGNDAEQALEGIEQAIAAGLGE
ncbi:phosphocarrier protein HPr /PTS system D-fructose-specific IIA component (F1P-forming) (Frc family) [Nicoletella semolina]|uniref:Phosphocarrier protein HPr /PTS system D-fructose-specific IIA component (F1P-forming) (Frc family) n=1 Tax=Nicoletella semolina TaxID=271160 RepID=A0A4R2N6K3_9PAST|nr:fused PTS fructose transporter subunit IIA/HPr protein [Nicoletella semolina]MDH2925175.1 hypothetical protein [Nicoletella semolina]TCP16514.1 phosphocarrier protein HPr /PTS system D-fructose-specific IIA component (F1P-forming) (Frc family) [Nicoletella semolina]